MHRVMSVDSKENKVFKHECLRGNANQNPSAPQRSVLPSGSRTFQTSSKLSEMYPSLNTTLCEHPEIDLRGGQLIFLSPRLLIRAHLVFIIVGDREADTSRGEKGQHACCFGDVIRVTAGGSAFHYELFWSFRSEVLQGFQAGYDRDT